MVLLGVGLLALIVAIATVDFVARDGGLLASGPLSSAHASLSNDCSACHTPGGEVVNDACSTCHEKYGDELGVYTFSAHYLYRTNDFQRLVPSPQEVPCSSCHPEHQGSQAEIISIEDSRCLDCHAYGSFNRDHPPFEVAPVPAEEAPLSFTHIHHVKEVMERQQLVDLEKACLHCHQPRPDGKSFQAIDFGLHCDSCHLTTGVGTPRLPIAAAGSDEIGVETLDAILQQGAPGSRWALFTNPGEFRQAGNGVRKSPLDHRDPWVLHNLRRLRGLLFEDPGLADLLQASADIPPDQVRDLYREAIETLEGYTLGLRSTPDGEVQKELERIEGMLRELRRALRDPYTPLDETHFPLALGEPREGLSEERKEEIHSLIADLTQPCTSCHRVEDATIQRVQKDQRTWNRAEFNHRAHILQRRCLDCHQEIPFEEYLGDGAVSTEKPPADLDHAGIENLPTMETCQDCHRPQVASNRCATCHVFHPDQSRRSELLLYLD